MVDEEIRVLLRRLSRPDRSGSLVIERAAVMAVGADSSTVVGWILTHGGVAETNAPSGRNRGLHGPRITGGDSPGGGTPQRYLLPAHALAHGD